MNYSITRKGLLIFVFTIDKFCAYLIGSPIVVFIDHTALKYLLTKKNAKVFLIWWIIFLQEFDLIIKNKRGVENIVASIGPPFSKIITFSVILVKLPKVRCTDPMSHDTP